MLKIAMVFLGLLLCCTVPGQAEDLYQVTDNGDFRVEVSLGGGRLEPGPNSLDLMIRDRAGQLVEGAGVTIAPWMPTMGHGVWDKPVVTPRGGGGYHVENIRIIMGGRWDLRVTVRKGSLEGQAVFPFTVAESGGQPPGPDAEQQEDHYERITSSYSVPNVTLLNQDGMPVRLKSLTDAGKPVIMDFIFTTCTTICPVLSAGLANLRAELGEKAVGVQIVSITIDPEHDRPERLKAYGARFNAGEGWVFLTGSREDIGLVLKAFDAFIVDKMSHEPLIILRGPHADEWVRIKGMPGAGELMNEFRRIENK